LNNSLYVGRLEWNRCSYIKDPKTGKRVARPNAKEVWEVVQVPELRLIDDDLWDAVRLRQRDLSFEIQRDDAGNALNRAHRRKFLLSGLLKCGCCGGGFTIVAQDRYGCATHRNKGTCANGTTIRRQEFEARVLAGRAFKDKKSNYYLRDGTGRLKYYTAIRVPQALENRKLLHLVKQGVVRQEELVNLERHALNRLRAFDVGGASLEQTLDSVMAYSSLAELGAPTHALPGSRSFGDLRLRYLRTLQDRPWKQCSCAICAALAVEVIIFRGSNRNKRRGIYNIGVYKSHIANSDEASAQL
jgi:Recombinase zinc beta ribbon domain